MSKPKWTPGPWTVLITGMRGSFHIPQAQAHEAGHADDGVDGYSVSKANAQLIAAAPELYEALANLVSRFEQACRYAGSDAKFIGEATTKARAALASARGDAP